ncbi:holin family protein [Vannielia litorea]|uniref:holin family protein n=1 Tax=Vannielia litorea TaxID=1217970 RepID=UPI001C972E74|nr:holin family protein [Vannielia litorea]MBY6046880.1 holin family protein [Vannielia litorea]MBY6074294.1 holin family protein [Vannielia litorea]
MGLITAMLTALFGGGRNGIAETVEVFRENAENASARAAAYQGAALEQFGREFMVERKGWFDRFMDGLNRLPRPVLALGTIFLMLAALVDPIWFAARMQGIALVPEPLWWLMGAIVSFYFGARHQVKGQEFQRSIAATVALAPQVQANMAALAALQAGAGERGVLAEGAEGENPALDDWRGGRAA